MLTNRKFYIAGFIVSLFLAGVVSFYASSDPDGLEKVAGDIGFIETAKEHTNADGTLADYGVKGIDNERASVGVAGVIGVMFVAIYTSHLKVGFFVFLPNQGWEYCAFISVTALSLATIGSGKYSLDNTFEVFKDGWLPFTLCALLAVTGAALHLALFYRPTSKP